MEQLFNDIQERIALNFPYVSERVDEEYGQLEAPEEHNPIVFPCVLISAPETSWGNISSNTAKVQIGDVRLVVSLCVNCYDDTHYNSTTEKKISERQAMADHLHALLQGYEPQGCRQQLSRTYSRNYTIQGGIKVYEQTYSVQIIDAVKDLTPASAMCSSGACGVSVSAQESPQG